MSADLLAEFGTGAGHADTRAKPQQPFQVQSNDDPFSDDEFDSFVSPETGDHGGFPDLQEKNLNVSDSNHGAHTAFQAYALPEISDDAEVLFDASLESKSEDKDEDDWGTFETANPVTTGQLLDVDSDLQTTSTPSSLSKPSASHVSAAFDLLSMDETSPKRATRIPQQSSDRRNSRPPGLAKVKQQSPLKSHVQSKKKEDDFFGEWDDFEDKPKTSLPSQNEEVSKSINATSKAPITSHGRTQSIVRPTNIPPPSVLFQVIPGILETFRKQVNNIQRMPTVSNRAWVPDLARTLCVCSRIISGRTLRWKRDTLLSQSMKIGPAQSGKSSGMKLSSISKGELIKEEQEVVSALEAWHHHASAFNSLLQSTIHHSIPVVTDKTRIITLAENQGALKASHACALCGLKRDERIPKLDDDVQDSFGEWWIEHWGHTDCKWFWEEFSVELQHR